MVNPNLHTHMKDVEHGDGPVGLSINPTGGLPIPQARPYEGMLTVMVPVVPRQASGVAPPQQSRAAAGAVGLLAIRSGAPNVALAVSDDKRQVPKGRG